MDKTRTIEAGRITSQIFAAWLIAQGVFDETIREAEVPSGASWATGGEMLAKDAVSKLYEVGGNVKIKADKSEWISWNKGEIGQRKEMFDMSQLEELGSDEKICRIHTHTETFTLGPGKTIVTPTNPPGLGDLTTLLRLVTDERISYRAASKVVAGVFDGLGFWSYGVQDPIALRRRTSTRELVHSFLTDLEPHFTEIRRLWLAWLTAGTTLSKDPEFAKLSNEAKVSSLKDRMFASLQKAYADAGFYIRYDAHKTALRQAPCLKPGQ